MLSDEEKKEYEKLKSLLYTGTISQYGKRKLIDMFEKQQKEIEELKKPKYLLNAKTGEITTINNSEFISKDKIKAKIEEMKKQIDLDNECEIALNNRIMDLEKEIEELKDESKEYQIGFAQGCYDKDLDWKDKIKAKIDYLLKQYDSENFINFEMFIKVLQSLLEKEEE